MTDTHVAAYFDGRGGKKNHTGTIWDCPKGRCMEWTALWRHDLHTAIDRTDRPIITHSGQEPANEVDSQPQG